MTHQKVTSNIQLAELLADHNIESFAVDKDQYPAIAVIKDDQFITLVPFAEFEPEDWMGDIRRVLEWHDQVMEKGITSNDYDALMKARSKLAFCMEWLGQLKASTAKDYLKAGYDRRRKRDNLKLIYRGQDMTITMAEAKARTETKSYDDDHIAACERKIQVETLYDTVKETLNAMAGERHTLENELKTLSYQNQ